MKLSHRLHYMVLTVPIQLEIDFRNGEIEEMVIGFILSGLVLGTLYELFELGVGIRFEGYLSIVFVGICV